MPGFMPGIHAVTSQREGSANAMTKTRGAPLQTAKAKEDHVMVNIYLFIELLHTANAVTTVDTLKALEMQNCKFANVVVLSDEKVVGQLDCKDSTDGDKAILNKIAKVDGVVQTNIIAVVRPTKG
jgi:hypothetical protein